MVSGNPVEAVEHYARSLEGTDRDGAMFQIRVDLITMADALAMCGSDETALEVAGIVEALDDDFGFPPEAQWHFQGRNYVAEAAERLGLEAAERALAAGRGVPASDRVEHACAVARTPANANLQTPIS